MLARRLTHPLALAVLLTLANAPKPVVVDDTAYLLFARQIAQHPLDPYGFNLFWYHVPEPAMTILAPPVLPYWLAAGIGILGENLILLKLWLFPFAGLLAWSLNALLHRFARGAERPALALLIFSPAILPTFNFMLDIPALALGLASLVIFLRACDRHSCSLAILAGIALAFALQTKYTMLIMPVVLAWAGLLQRRIGLTVIALATAALLFTLWEAWLLERYGQSHFLFHLRDQQSASEESIFTRKWALVPAFFSFLGATLGMLGFWAASVVGWPPWLVRLAAMLSLVGLVFVVAFPFPDTVLIVGSQPNREKLTLASLLWRSLGAGAGLTVLAAIGVLFLKWHHGPRWRHSRSWARLFLVGWLAIEVAGYFTLTPFPAGRRLIGTTVAAGVLLARVVSRVRRAHPERAPSGWVLPAAIVAGGLFALLDAYEASIERSAIVRVTEVASGRGDSGTVWFVGHWGMQYYGERAGLRHFIPGGPQVQPGDWLVLPEHPDATGFYRPYSGGDFEWYRLKTPNDAECVERLIFDDSLSAMTVPTFYGGVEPIVGRSRPRLILGIYRMKQTWGPGSRK